jgi:bacillithiol biosynthesis cysteine-adding enzyme BshC
MSAPRLVLSQGTSSFIRDYMAGAPALAAFYTGHPYDITAYARKAREVAARMDAAKRAEVAESYRPLNDDARRKLDRILKGDGFVVTTGQQAGVFTGPLYTIYKALSAVRLAAALEASLKCPVLAVFWVAADDHDWPEVDHVRVLDGFDYLRDVRVGAPADEPAWPMSRKVLGADVERAVDELSRLIPQDGFGADMRAMLRRTYTAGKRVADAFEDLMAEMLAPFPLAIVSSAHPAIKRASLPVVLHELARAEEHERLVTEQSAKLAAAGYPSQVALTASASNVFLLRDEGRDRLLREGDQWLLRRTGTRIEKDTLIEGAQADPQILSANVFLRPVVESAVFPTLSYVGGPAETAYFAQIGCLFKAHGIEPPVIFPRHGLTIVEEKATRTLAKFGHDESSVRKPFAEVVTDLVKAEMPETVRAALDQLESAVGDAYDAVGKTVPEVDPTLAGPVRGSRHRAQLEVRRIEKQIEKQYRARNETRIEQLRRAATSIYPGGPQERILNVVPFLATYGPTLLHAMHDAMPVALDRTMPEWNGVECGEQHGSGGAD